MDKVEKKIVDQWAETVKPYLSLKLETTNDNRSKDIEEFCRELVLSAPDINLIVEKADEDKFPSIKIENNWQIFLIPSGEELEPFLDLLSRKSNPDNYAIPSTLEQKAREISLPAHLRLFVTTFCHHCPAIANSIAYFPFENPLIKITLIDGALFPELAEEYNVKAAPTLIFDKYSWTGQISLKKILDLVIDRDPLTLKADMLEDMILNGKAGDVAQLMIEKEIIFPAFIDLLTHNKWPVRLGAMVSMEEIADKNPLLAHKVLDQLWGKIENSDYAVRGDIVYMIGEIGNKDWTQKIRPLLDHPCPDEFRDAVEEALSNIEERV